MTMITSAFGNQLVEFLPPDAPLDPAIPLTFTQVVATFKGAALLVYVTHRGQWETPGGGIEPGEPAAVCAARELWEESGQVAESLTFASWFRVRFPYDNREEYGALYTATLAEIRPFTPNDETARILLWNGTDALDDRFGDWSRAFIAQLAGKDEAH
ncbi:MAG: NUDIX hydrolase [Chloroflexi bacterium]|nr:NUDIX hydrolase [Chloroflexota bacterium]